MVEQVYLNNEPVTVCCVGGAFGIWRRVRQPATYVQLNCGSVYTRSLFYQTRDCSRGD